MPPVAEPIRPYPYNVIDATYIDERKAKPQKPRIVKPAKRTAAETSPPDPKKRRKDETLLMPAPPAPAPTPAAKKDERPTDLSSLPTHSLVSYLVKHDILPPIHPSPYTSQPAPIPSTLLNPTTHTPQPDDLTQPPILTDLDSVHTVLARLAERHWHTKSVRETDTIAAFVWSAQRARERTLLAASSAS